MIEIPSDAAFFEPEVREDFYISRMMKRLWAAQIVVLRAVDAVCARHGIRWYADNGTLIGAVRHGGYIPWDDDLDICMFRGDYRRFLSVAAEELPEGYQIRNIHSDPDCLDLTTRILNSDSIRLDTDFLTENAGFPYVAGIDIFPLDDLAADDKEEQERCRRICDIAQLGQFLIEQPDADETWELYEKVQRENGVAIENGGLSRQLSLLTEELYAKHTGSGSPYVALMHYWSRGCSDHKYERAMFDVRLTMPFENTKIYVPGIYTEVLRVEYGDYMRIVKSGSLHEWPIYAPQEALLAEAAGGKNPLKYDFEAAVNQGAVKMPAEHGGAPGLQKIITDPLLGYDPYGGVRAQIDPSQVGGDVEEVVLVPSLQPEPCEEWRDMLPAAMEEQILSPMMVYADRVLLRKESLRTLYLKKLKQVAPGITWEKKIGIEKTDDIRVKDKGASLSEKGNARGRKKVLLFYTGYSTLLSHREKTIEKIRCSLKVMLEHAGDIEVLWLAEMLLPKEEENLIALREKEPELFAGWARLLNEYEPLLTADKEEAIARADAFYGDAGNVAHRCRLAGKPVMVWTV